MVTVLLGGSRDDLTLTPVDVEYASHTLNIGGVVYHRIKQEASGQRRWIYIPLRAK